MATEQCSPVVALADQIVTLGYDTFRAYANDAYGNATAAANALASFSIDPVPVNVSFNPQGVGGQFIRPPRPSRTIREFDPPDSPPDVDIEPVKIDLSGITNAPDDPGAGYTYRKPGGEPGPLTATDPGPAPTVEDVTIPVAPTYTLPAVPDFYELDLPDVPNVQVPTFTATRPEINFAAPAETFAFQEVEYTSALLDEVTARLSTMLQGGTGLPAAIEQALFDRARSREDMLAAKQVQEVVEDFANRGATEPNGVLARRVLEVRQENRNRASALNRDLTIRVHEVEIENIRFAVTQGIALEQVLISKHLAMEQRRFEAARFAFEAVLQIFNARVTLFNAEIEGYRADAAVFRDRIQGALAEVELYRAQIEGQRAIGELNKTLAERYETELRGVLALIDTYRAEVEAARIRIEANVARIEGYRATVQAFGERVRAYEAEWNGYRARVEAELGNLRSKEIDASIYGTRVNAWSTKLRTRFEQANTDVSIEELRLRKFGEDMRKFLGLIELERSKVAADVAALGADAQVYAADGSIAQAESAAQDRTLEINITRARTEAELQLKNGEININQALQASAQTLEALRGVAQTTSQLAASALSAINVSAGLSHSVGESKSCGTSFNYSGELAT